VKVSEMMLFLGGGATGIFLTVAVGYAVVWAISKW